MTEMRIFGILYITKINLKQSQYSSFHVLAALTRKKNKIYL